MTTILVRDVVIVTSSIFIQTLQPQLPADAARASRVRAASRRRYARPRAAVEAEIAQRFGHRGTG